jgi:hypothetical protein
MLDRPLLWHVLGVLFLVNALGSSRATKELYQHKRDSKPSQLDEQLLQVSHAQLKHGQHYTLGSSNLNNGSRVMKCSRVEQSMLTISGR